jgi:hypothetical protein
MNSHLLKHKAELSLLYRKIQSRYNSLCYKKIKLFKKGKYLIGFSFMSIVLSSLLISKFKNQQNVNRMFLADSNKTDSKFIVKNKPKIIIIYDESNSLQKELVEIIINRLTKQYFPLLCGDNLLQIEIVNVNQIKELKYSQIDSNKIKNSNEPTVIIQNILNLPNEKKKYINNLISPFTFVSNEKWNLFQILDNLLLIKRVDSLTELREEFRYLENPLHSIILIHPSLVNEESLSLFRDSKTKMLVLTDENLLDFCGLKEGLIYQYFPAKLPYKMKDMEKFLNDYVKLKSKSHNEPHDILKEEGVDLNAYLTSNPIELMLRYGMFRDEIKISKDLVNNLASNKFYDSHEISSKEARIKVQKLVSYPQRNVTKLAEIDPSLIESYLNKENQHLLFIYIPNWSNLKENIFESILFDSPHLFNSILVTNSRDFTFKHELYDDTQISEDIPQIYLIETNKIKDKKIYNLNYFRFPDDFSKYLKNKKEIFKKPELMENLTYVSTLNSKNFEDKVINDKSFKEFLVEVKHEGCPTCYMLGKMFDHVSQKFQKHKYEKKIKMFRVDTHNDLPYLGEFAATPTYLFCRKNDKGEVELISQIDKSEFLFKIKKLSKFDLNKARYHPNIGFGFYIFQRNEFMKDNYDPDLDISGFNI